MAGGAGAKVNDEERTYSYLDLARLPSFRKLWLGDIFSQSSDRMAFVAITILAYGEGASAWELSAIIGAYFFPAILVGIPGGIVADRFPRRTVMVAAEGVRVAIALVLAFLVEELWLIPMVLVFSSLTYLFYPSRQASIPCLVPPRALLPANASISANLILGFAIGPPIAGVLSSYWGPDVALVAAAGTMLVGVALIASIRDETVCTPARDPEDASTHVLLEGLSVLKGKAVLWQGFIIVGWIMFAVGGGAVGLVVFGDEVLDMGEEGFSWLLSALALGTLVGAGVIGAGSPDRPKGGKLLAAVFFAAAMFGILPLTDDPIIAAIIIFLLGICASMVLVPFTTLLHERMGDHVMGTSFGLLSMGLTTPMVLGIVVAGPFIEAQSVLHLFWMFGILLTAVGIVAFAFYGLRTDE